MIKKIYLIVSVIILVSIIFLAYVLANYIAKDRYVKSFERCQENLPEFKAELEKVSSRNPESLRLMEECVSLGGCYDKCARRGINCDVIRPSVEFSELSKFYLPKPCESICKSACLASIKY